MNTTGPPTPLASNAETYYLPGDYVTVTELRCLPVRQCGASLDRTSNKGQDAVLTERFINLRRQPGVQMVRRAIERERHSLRMIYDL